MSFERSSEPLLCGLACLVMVGCAGGGTSSWVDDAGLAGSAAGASGAAPGLSTSGAGMQSLDDGASVAGGGGAADAGVAADATADANGASATDAAVPADAGALAPRPPCVSKGSQVVLLGDSYINWVSHTFPADLYREAGATYRMYAVGAYSMGSGGIGFIPPELDQALAEDPDINLVVMTGGGNDVLVADTTQFPQGGDCKMSASSPTIPDCQKIVDKALAAAEEMMDNGVAHGIGHIVYFFYPNVPEGTLVGGTHPNAILEYAAPRVKDFCDGSYARTGGKATCYFVDLRPVFSGHPEYFAPTDIHPNTMGSAAMAKAVWQTMKDNCLAQPQSSGCCEP